VSLARRILGPAVFHGRLKARRWRIQGTRAVESATQQVAPLLYREADRLATFPFRDVQLPPAGRELLDDLAAYTGLTPAVVAELVSRRPVDFRAEWHATPVALRDDRWFYLSSKMYLFGNAVHFVDDPAVDDAAAHIPDGSTVLEFGCGAGNLTVALARRGHTVVAEELSALQRDFLRFRVHRHGLDDRVSVRDPWVAVQGQSADVITAFDVLEHLPGGRATVAERLLPALRDGGLLIENSPFVQNVANPMHHQDWGLDEQLGAAGMALETVAADGTRVWRLVR
jgi:hypothetical protein